MATSGRKTPVTPKFISVADPASRWTDANGGLAFFAYCTTYLDDLQHAVIMDVEATTAVRRAEVTAQRVMLDRTQERLGLWPERLAADSGYGDAANLAWPAPGTSGGKCQGAATAGPSCQPARRTLTSAWTRRKSARLSA
jgi:hypothetical protein